MLSLGQHLAFYSLAFHTIVPYLWSVVISQKTSGIKTMWNDPCALQGVGSAVIEYRGRSVSNGRIANRIANNC